MSPTYVFQDDLMQQIAKGLPFNEQDQALFDSFSDSNKQEGLNKTKKSKVRAFGRG